MSATIPDFMIQNIINEVFNGDESKLIRPNPTIKSDRDVLDQKRHILHCQPGLAITDKVYLIKEYLNEREGKKSKSVLVIVNNVKTAQRLYEEIGFDDADKVALLHSGFNKRDRIEIEKRITNEEEGKRPQLLIATQAVEVSLDIDYDVAFIENAPIDALIQRFGRVNRAGKKNLAPIYLFENIIGNTRFFYDENVLKNTWNYLLALNEKELSENDLTEVCNQVYKNGYTEGQQKDFIQGLDNLTIQNFENDWIAGDWNNWIEDVLERNNQKTEVLCHNLIDEFDKKKQNKQYIEANQFLVQVYWYELENPTKDAMRNVIIANNLIYDEIIGYKKKDESFNDRSL